MFAFDMSSPKYWYKTRVISEMEFLSIFINDIEEQVDSSIKRYENEKQTEVVEDENSYSEISFHKGLNDMDWNLDEIFKNYFPTTQRSSALITIYSFFENELDKLCFLFCDTEKYKIELNDITGKGINRSVKYLKRVADININNEDKNWIEIANIQKIRNLFTHNRGKLYDVSDDVSDDVIPDFSTNEKPIAKNKNESIERKIAEGNDLLSISANNEIFLHKGYLNSVLNIFDSFFKEIDSKIKLKYSQGKITGK